MTAVSRATGRRAELTDHMLGIVAEQGLDRLSVREVASAAGVSIGTVQHHFRTKDEMLVAALEEVVLRTRERLAAVRLTGDPRRDFGRVLRELLPLDDERAAEARTQLAFAARAATRPELATIQVEVLAGIHDELAAAFRAAGQPAARSRRSALAALAATDGLAQHAVSTGAVLRPDELTAALDHVLAALLAD